MEKKLELVRAEGELLESLKSLYLEAFPEEERKPFPMMQKWQEEGKMEILAIVEDGRFVGLDINMTAPDSDLSLLDYFAVNPELRGGGYGSRALSQILERFAGKQMIFEIEPQDETAENAEARRRRKAFYLRNGLLETGIFVSLFDVPFELLAKEPGLSFPDYQAVLLRTLGPFYYEMAHPSLLLTE